MSPPSLKDPEVVICSVCRSSHKITSSVVCSTCHSRVFTTPEIRAQIQELDKQATAAHVKALELQAELYQRELRRPKIDAATGKPGSTFWNGFIHGVPRSMKPASIHTKREKVFTVKINADELK